MSQRPWVRFEMEFGYRRDWADTLIEMREQRKRSVFWMVSTHVVTAGFAFPFLASVLLVVIITSGWIWMSPLAQMLFSVALLSLAYIGGTCYSLSYLRKVAVCDRPQACIVPSIVVFGVLAGASLMLTYGKVEPMEFGILTVYFAGITLFFAFITRRGFLRMDAARKPMGFEVKLLGEQKNNLP